MSDRNHDLIARIQAGDPISASQLLNKLVDAANRQDARQVLRGIDAGHWLRCVSSVDAPAWSILGIDDVEINYDGLTLQLSQATENHDLFAANEGYRLTADSKGWCKLINETHPVMVNCLAPAAAFLSDLTIDGFSVTLGDSGTGTGTGTGSSGTITPPGRLWAFSPRDLELRCAVMGSRTTTTLRAAVFLLAGPDPVIGGGISPPAILADCYMVPDGITPVFSTTYPVYFNLLNGVVIPYSDYAGVTSATTVTALKLGNQWVAIAGGLTGLSGTKSSGGLTSVYGSEVSASNWCNAIIPNGASVIAVMIDEAMMIIGDCCYTGTGTGT